MKECKIKIVVNNYKEIREALHYLCDEFDRGLEFTEIKTLPNVIGCLDGDYEPIILCTVTEAKKDLEGKIK